MKGPGLKPPQRGLFRREVIGPPQCPLMVRWTLLSIPWGKVLVHHFQPNANDTAEHDHPASFLTVVLAGGYDDYVPCPACDGCLLVDDPDLVANPEVPRYATWMPCEVCSTPQDGPTGSVLGDRMRRGMVRLRRAEHRHCTRVGPDGCWTLVFMAAKRREWGFWKNGIWMPWREYELRFGFATRCPEPPDPSAGRVWG